MEADTEGHYAKKQIHCKDPIVAWSHQSRFLKAKKLVAPLKGQRLLDYGCGDGTFLQMVEELFPDALGADIVPYQVEDCTKRLSKPGGLSFVLNKDLGESYTGKFDVITCMEVLEHCVEKIEEIVLNDLHRLCAPNGLVIISVPIEIGPTVAMKYMVRKVAGWRGLSDYKYYEKIGLWEMTRSIFASSKTKLDRPIYGNPGEEFHSHKGFNWRRLKRNIEKQFTVVKTKFSPLGWLGGFVSSQAWIVCRPM